MKKNVFNILLLAATIFGLGMSVTSCKDDNEENKSEEQKEQEAQEKASKFWNVVGQLVSVDDVTEDYQGKTFEPTYGLPDPTNSVTRIVNTNDMKTAAQRFANLVNAKGIDENTPSYNWSDPEIGTMTYTRGGDAANWATVDVDIKAVPGLQRIIYREGGEGTNGKFNGKAYYRFGDVVSRQVNITYDQKKNNDDRRAITEYWICVRPAFGPEGKEDSHWVCVNTVSDKNYKYYKASTGTDYWLPTNLKTDKENMQNFAELLWAICYPDEWYKNVDEHHRDGTLWGFDGVPFFTDFKKANLDLHNQYFWQNVQDAWDRKQIAEQALNMPDLAYLVENFNRNGVHLLYKGYSWIFLTSWNCELSEAVYTNGKAEEELNMHHAVYNEDVERNMKDIRFDVREMGKEKDNYNGFFNNDGKYRWVIRHATGKELATDKKYDVKKPITGVKEEYRYYRDVEEWQYLDSSPEVTRPPYSDVLAEPRPGCVIGQDGQFHTKAQNAIALVVYVGEKGSVEEGTDYRGLAISLRNAGGSKPASEKWMSGNDYQSCTETIDPIFKAQLVNCLNGIKMTDKLVADGHSHPAAQQCRNFKPKLGNGFSDWFLPSAGQWILMAKGLFGAKWEYGEFILPGKGTDYDSFNILSKLLEEANVTIHEIPSTEWMWSVTEASPEKVWIVSFMDGSAIEIDSYNDKTNYLPVLPMVAF